MRKLEGILGTSSVESGVEVRLSSSVARQSTCGIAVSDDARLVDREKGLTESRDVGVGRTE